MTTRSVFWNRIATFAGLASLIFCLLLLPAGVRLVRAEDGDEKAKAKASSAEAVAAKPAAEVEEPGRAGRTDVTSQPAVLVLNNRGYNYGPPPVDRTPTDASADKSK